MSQTASKSAGGAASRGVAKARFIRTPDRLIVATALVHGAEVVSKDEKIRAYRHVRSIC